MMKANFCLMLTAGCIATTAVLQSGCATRAGNDRSVVTSSPTNEVPRDTAGNLLEAAAFGTAAKVIQNDPDEAVKLAMLAGRLGGIVSTNEFDAVIMELMQHGDDDARIGFGAALLLYDLELRRLAPMQRPAFVGKMAHRARQGIERALKFAPQRRGDAERDWRFANAGFVPVVHSPGAPSWLKPRGQDDDGDAYGLRRWMVFKDGVHEHERTPSVFKAVNVTLGAGDSAIWTPAAGKKFRLMGWSLSSNVSGAALNIKDGSTVIIVLTTSTTTPSISPHIGNGYLSTAANNALNVQHAAATVVWGVVFGTEE